MPRQEDTYRGVIDSNLTNPPPKVLDKPEDVLQDRLVSLSEQGPLVFEQVSTESGWLEFNV